MCTNMGVWIELKRYTEEKVEKDASPQNKTEMNEIQTHVKGHDSSSRPLKNSTSTETQEAHKFKPGRLFRLLNVAPRNHPA